MVQRIDSEGYFDFRRGGVGSQPRSQGTFVVEYCQPGESEYRYGRFDRRNWREEIDAVDARAIKILRPRGGMHNPRLEEACQRLQDAGLTKPVFPEQPGSPVEMRLDDFVKLAERAVQQAAPAAPAA